MLSFPTVQGFSSFPSEFFCSYNFEENFSDACPDGFLAFEIVIEESDFFVDEPVKKVKADNGTGRNVQPNPKQSTPVKLDSIHSMLNSPESTQSFKENSNNIQYFKNSQPISNFKETECFIQDVLGKRRNPVFSEEGYSVESSIDVHEKVKLNSDLDKLSVVNEDSETTAEENLEHNTDGFIPVGPAYQAELPALMNKSKGESRMSRSPKVMWNPEKISTVALNNCLEKMYQTVNQNITNHEKAVKLLMENDMNVDKLINEMKKNKLFYRTVFSLNQRVRRNKTLC